MQYVGNATVDDAGSEVSGVVLTAAPSELRTFLDYTNQEIDQPWVKVVGQALEQHVRTEATWIGAFVPMEGDLDRSDDTLGRPVGLQIWDEQHASNVIERVVVGNGRAFYILAAA